MNREQLTEWLRKNDMSYLYEEWSNGGTAGNCWDDELHYIGASEPKELTIFDELVEVVKPDITFIQYKNMKNALVKTKTWSEGDYYGGSQSFTRIYVNEAELFDYLEEKGWLPES